MAAPKHRRPKKAFIHFAIAAVIALVVGAIGVGLFLFVLGGVTEESQLAKQKEQELAQKVSDLENKLNTKKEITYTEVKSLRKIPIGTIIDETMVNEVQLGAEKPDINNYSKKSSVIGQMAGVDIMPGQALTKENLIKPEGKMAVNPGMRAISIMVNSVASVGGAVLPGSRVDILGTFSNEKLTQTLLQNVKVIAVSDTMIKGGAMSKTPNRGGPIITVEVSPKDAQALALAAQSSVFHLTLRNFSDDKVSDISGTDLGNVISGAYADDLNLKIPELPAQIPNEIPVNFTGNIMGLPQPAVATPSAREFTMEIYKGSNAETQSFELESY